MPSPPSHLEPSELGTKSYWEDYYARELANHSQNPEDEGTIWFSDSAAEEKVLEFLEELADEGILSKGDPSNQIVDRQASSFLDLGTGNGHFLFALRDDGWAGDMLGVDYSPASIQLARQIDHTRRQRHSATLSETSEENLEFNIAVEFKEHDLLSESPTLQKTFDVVVDKGTFDAISLSSDVDSGGKRISEQYRARIKPFLKEEGLFVITSCNWTENELRGWIEASSENEADYLVFKDRINYPSFRFGGREGQSVVTLCFRRLVKHSTI